MRRLTLVLLSTGTLLFAAGCGSDDSAGSSQPDASAPATSTAESSGQTGGAAASSDDAKFPDVKKAELTASGSGTYTLAVTVSSPYDSPERYADGWRVFKGGTQEEIGTGMVGHDHASEQPFTRESELTVPDGVTEITVEGRDQKNGYGGDTVTIDVPQ